VKVSQHVDAEQWDEVNNNNNDDDDDNNNNSNNNNTPQYRKSFRSGLLPVTAVIAARHSKNIYQQ